MGKTQDIKLYKCDICGKSAYAEQLHQGLFCRCGSNRFRYCEPTFWRIVEYFARNPKMLLAYLKENILKGDFSVVKGDN